MLKKCATFLLVSAVTCIPYLTNAASPSTFDSYHSMASSGNADAQFKLGEIYYYGQNNIKTNYTLALQWYTRAAQQGHTQAQYELADMYYLGKGVPENEVLAAQWYARAAQQGHADAQNDLGDMYYLGTGVPENEALAIQWYTKAAQQGHVKARENLNKLTGRSFNPTTQLSSAVESNNTVVDTAIRSAVDQVISSTGLGLLKKVAEAATNK